MFGLMHNLYKWVKRKREKRVTLCIIGLDNAGKTTLLHGFMSEPAGIAVPTFGFNSETVLRKQYTVTFYDLGGGGTIRGIWKQYYAEVHGAVFVIDAADEDRFDEAATALRNALTDPLFAAKPLLILANKQDVHGSRSADEISETLDLPGILPDTTHRISQCTALRPPNSPPMDKNVEIGWDWLLGEIDKQFNVLSRRVDGDVSTQKAKQAQEMKEKKERVERVKLERKMANLVEEEQEKDVVSRESMHRPTRVPEIRFRPDTPTDGGKWEEDAEATLVISGTPPTNQHRDGTPSLVHLRDEEDRDNQLPNVVRSPDAETHM